MCCPSFVLCLTWRHCLQVNKVVLNLKCKIGSALQSDNLLRWWYVLFKHVSFIVWRKSFWNISALLWFKFGGCEPESFWEHSANRNYVLLPVPNDSSSLDGGEGGGKTKTSKELIPVTREFYLSWRMKCIFHSNMYLKQSNRRVNAAKYDPKNDTSLVRGWCYQLK